MRLFSAVVATAFLVTQTVTAQSSHGLSGSWKLNPAQSDVSALPGAPDALLTIQESSTSVVYSVAATETTFPLGGKTDKRQTGDSSISTSAKWEGSTLLTTTVVGGPQTYTITERWRQSRDGNTLTISRTIRRLTGEREGVLVYERPNVAVTEAVPAPAPIESTPQEFVIDSGTRILLRLTNSVNTKHTQPGDRVYLETVVPVFVNRQLVIPRGSYVAGTVTEAERAGRVKGKSAMNIRFDTLTLANGVTRDFRSRAGAVDTKGDVDRKEGRIQGEGNKTGDAATIGKTTAAGASAGTLAGAAVGHVGAGVGIGAAAGAAAGLAGVLLSRGQDVILPAGTSVEMVLDRELRFAPGDLR